MAYVVAPLMVGVVWLGFWGLSVLRGSRSTREFRDAFVTGDWPSNSRKSPLFHPLYRALPATEWLTCREICSRIPPSITGGRSQIGGRMSYLVEKRFAERRLPPIRKVFGFPYRPLSAIRYRKLELIATTAAEGGTAQPPARRARRWRVWKGRAAPLSRC